MHEAFTQNHCVPTLLLASEGLPELDELSAYSKGDGTEAAMYVHLALKAWQQIPGALEWLKEMALQAHLFSEQTGKRKGTVPRITIHVVAQQEGEDTVATALFHHMDIDDLNDLDLSYTPRCL